MNKERGASAAEYALLVAGIAGLLVIIILALGQTTLPLFHDTCEGINNEMSAGSTC